MKEIASTVYTVCVLVLVFILYALFDLEPVFDLSAGVMSECLGVQLTRANWCILNMLEAFELGDRKRTIE